ncbi:site-specific integrase [uncultured Lactobacillus sp.]|uniref:tyrosine-type recombinase/integrase n=1 Tax=uncultured Lactobacillus sp. TaxID=153152 RepID=UPI00262D1117|nr:site-specific integrase [uncultured Lactobacillus sp.]
MPRKKDPEIYDYKLKSGKTKYGFKTYIGINPETGKAIKPTRQGFDSYKEAEQAKIKLKAEGAKKVADNRKAELSRKTVQEVYDVWFSIKKNSVRGSTLYNIKCCWEKHIEPEFGDTYITNIDITHLQKFVDSLAKKYIGFKSKINVLHRLIKYAILRGWCEDDPFNKIVVPAKSSKKSDRPKKNYYDLDELKEFLNAAKKHNYSYYAFFVTLGNLGLRRGEALALKWKNIDFDKQIVHIDHTVAHDLQNKKVINEPKTYSGKRELTLSKKLSYVLKEYRKKQSFFNGDNDYIFHTKNGSFFNSPAVSEWMKSIYHFNPNLRKITAHGFRHSLATLLYEGSDKITPKDVQYILGHARVTTALNIYTHITQKQKSNIKNAVNNLNIE